VLFVIVIIEGDINFLS